MKAAKGGVLEGPAHNTSDMFFECQNLLSWSSSKLGSMLWVDSWFLVSSASVEDVQFQPCYRSGSSAAGSYTEVGQEMLYVIRSIILISVHSVIH